MRILVAGDTVLDARLAIYHRTENWLAVADLHYGYEVSQRAAGALFPLWGMESIEARLLALLADYRPAYFFLLGDLVHTRDAGLEAHALLERLRAVQPGCEVIAIAGNHDRRARCAGSMRELHVTEGFRFHHGDTVLAADERGRLSVMGHHHPARTVYDGAGLQMKLPAFVRTRDGWVLPAFSPWAAGGGGCRRFGADARFWLCGPRRVFEMPPRRRPTPGELADVPRG